MLGKEEATSRCWDDANSNDFFISSGPKKSGPAKLSENSDGRWKCQRERSGKKVWPRPENQSVRSREIELVQSWRSSDHPHQFRFKPQRQWVADDSVRFVRCPETLGLVRKSEGPLGRGRGGSRVKSNVENESNCPNCSGKMARRGKELGSPLAPSLFGYTSLLHPLPFFHPCSCFIFQKKPLSAHSNLAQLEVGSVVG